MDKKQVFFGTGNAKKLQEIGQILGESFSIKSFLDLEAPLDVEETESTLEGNARLKAMAFYAHTGIPCFADDTGLEVEALNGAPGVYSARYAGPENDATANMNKLLHALEGKSSRQAQFRTVIAWYDGKDLRFFEGVLKGAIGVEKRGNAGFGYDPIFIPAGSSRTLAEMEPVEKNAISHRGKAVQQLAQYLLQL
ncbi:MAG: RdgB/HAM1 family non-canonical purine NTP pyrophosphatase [Bacteroidia bacterium]|nr:RdgB/HAM1 family non-canonical purine NTP pyrophosphatase [Bacteroidia bacterium]